MFSPVVRDDYIISLINSMQNKDISIFPETIVAGILNPAYNPLGYDLIISIFYQYVQIRKDIFYED